MKEKLVFGLSIILSIAALGVFIANVLLTTNSHQFRQKINHRQAEINNAPTLSQFNQNLVNVLAEETVKHNDAEIRSLLSSEGIKVTETQGLKPPEKDSHK